MTKKSLKLQLKNIKYWSQRSKEIAALQYKKADKVVYETNNIYDMVLKNINLDIDKFYEKYSVNENITLQIAKKELNKSELKGFKMTLEEYRGKALNGDYERELESEYIKSRVSRLEALKAQVKLEILELRSKETKVIDKFLQEVYEDSYLRKMHMYFDGLGVEVSFAHINTKIAKQNVYNKWINENNFSDNIWSNKKKLLAAINKELIGGIIRGESQPNIVRKIHDKIGKTSKNAARYNSKRLVHTETANILEKATLDSYKTTYTDKYMIIATLDLKTSEICIEKDNKIYDVDKAKTGLNYPPFHVNCRTTTIPYLDDDLVTKLRIARDPKTGKSIEVPFMNYKKWKEKYVDSVY